MKRSRRIALRAGSLLAALSLLPLCGFEAVYRYGLGRIRDLPSLPTEPVRPPLLEHALWMSSGEDPPMRVQPVRGWHGLRALGAVFLSRRPEPLPGERAAGEAAQLILLDQPRDGMLDWHLMGWALKVRLTRHGSPGPLVHLIGQNAYFGRGAQGVSLASRLYFGKEAPSLEPQEIALLMVLKTSHTRFNPDCHPDHALAGRHRFLLRLLAEGALSQEQFDHADTKPLEFLPDSASRCR